MFVFVTQQKIQGCVEDAIARQFPPAAQKLLACSVKNIDCAPQRWGELFHSTDNAFVHRVVLASSHRWSRRQAESRATRRHHCPWFDLAKDCLDFGYCFWPMNYLPKSRFENPMRRSVFYWSVLKNEASVIGPQYWGHWIWCGYYSKMYNCLAELCSACNYRPLSISGRCFGSNIFCIVSQGWPILIDCRGLRWGWQISHLHPMHRWENWCRFFPSNQRCVIVHLQLFQSWLWTTNLGNSALHWSLWEWSLSWLKHSGNWCCSWNTYWD